MDSADLAFAVVSDIHGNRWALEAVLADIASRDVLEILNLGDSLYGPLDPAGTAELLLAHSFVSVRGNEDRIILERSSSATLDHVRRALASRHIDWLGQLPPTRVAHRSVFLCHGTPRQDDRYLVHQVTDSGLALRKTVALAEELDGIDQPVVLCGHDHLPARIRLAGARLIVNPGSVGLQAYTDDRPRAHRVQNGSPQARYAIVARRDDEWSAEQLSVDYDWTEAAAAAEANSRPDWAEWLRTGRAEQCHSESASDEVG